MSWGRCKVACVPLAATADCLPFLPLFLSSCLPLLLLSPRLPLALTHLLLSWSFLALRSLPVSHSYSPSSSVLLSPRLPLSLTQLLPHIPSSVLDCLLFATPFSLRALLSSPHLALCLTHPLIPRSFLAKSPVISPMSLFPCIYSVTFLSTRDSLSQVDDDYGNK